MYSILAFHKIPKINISTVALSERYLGKLVTYRHDVFLSETFKTELFFFTNPTVPHLTKLASIAQLLIIDNRGILNKKNLLEMAKNVAQKIREPANNIIYLLYRHECFTGKQIHNNYIRDLSGLFSIISHVT